MPVSLTRDPNERTLVTLGSITILTLVVGYFYVALTAPANVALPIGIAAVLIALSVPVIRRTARASDDPWAIWLLSAALIVKLLATLARYWVNNDLYGGAADAVAYHDSARILAESIHHGIFTLDGTPLAPFPQETQAVAWVLGLVYSVTGSAQVVGYLVFSWLGWLGLICFYRAFRIAFPGTRSRACILLLFFLPSLAYWPSSPGKEALISTCLGLATLGLAHLFAGRAIGWGVVSLVVGGAGIVWIRPHIAMLLLVAAAVALLVWRPGTGTAKSRIGRLLVLAALVPLLFIGIGRVNRLFGEDNRSVSLSTVLEQTRRQTSTGNSAFETNPVRSPADLPVALVSVLTRPFPWEVDNATMALASLEGMAFVVLVLARPKTLGRLIRVVSREPIGAFCAAYAVAFVIAFSNVGNAGILVRQRTQLLPLVVVLFAATAAPNRAAATTTAEADASADETPHGRIPSLTP